MEKVDLKLSDLDPTLQANVRALLPQIMVVLLKRVGGRIEISKRELERSQDFQLELGVNPQTQRVKLHMHMKLNREKKQ